MMPPTVLVPLPLTVSVSEVPIETVLPEEVLRDWTVWVTAPVPERL